MSSDKPNKNAATATAASAPQPQKPSVNNVKLDKKRAADYELAADEAVKL